ncbi:transposase family protein [Isoptericola jiangsuensis]|uniref:transposase family protein n=1 Tax=Isoptericola jiangsuensis TaxID=548579 RepID=UPI000BF2DE04|nr:transposase family protein [Isoptericola jiangsuensis]
MITYRATLDVPPDTLRTVTRWIAAHRRVRDIRPWQRVATARTQALLVLRWFKDSTRVHLLARDAEISIATAYRYLHEAVDVIALRAPDLHDVLATARQEDWPYVCLDGTLVATMQLHGPKNPSGAESWYSGKHHRHGGNIQVLCDPTGYPVWVSPVSPGSTHDITAARTRNKLLTGLRSVAERGNALLKKTWPALQMVTLDPHRLTKITAAALVLLHLQRGARRSRW